MAPPEPDSAQLEKAAKTKRRFFRRPKANNDSEHVGKVAIAQTFYESPYGDDSSWVEWAPPSLPAPKKKKFEGAAILVFKTLTTDEATQPGIGSVADRYKTSCIRLHSPFIREALEQDLKEHHLNFDAKGHADSKGEHSALLFCRDKIAQLAKTSDDEVTRSHCEVLCTVIEENLGPALDAIDQYEKSSVITWEALWTLFPTGLVFGTEVADKLRAFRVISFEIDREKLEFKLNCEYVDFDGYRYGTQGLTMTYPYFDGQVEVSKLTPFIFIDLSKNAEVRERLLRRGRSLLRYQGPQFVAKPEENDNQFSTKDLSDNDERIMIDAYIAYDPPLVLKPLPGYAKWKKDRESTQLASQDHESVAVNIAKDKKNKPMRTRPTPEDIKQNTDVMTESEDTLLIADPLIPGYSLREGRWKFHDVEELQDVSLATGAFRKVVFEDKKKEILHVLARAYLDSDARYYDLIAGKGQCLLILLSGQPGTGKTLLAESLADHLERPLLRIHSIISSSDPNEISGEFQSKVKMASEWGALILFDEANFIVQNRNAGDNNIISTFLRHIEYFKGIVFLTTNMTTNIDPALQSRVHIHLTFSNLTREMRALVWRNFAEGGPKDLRKLDDADVERLSEWQMNGREIKNAFNMAVSWARRTKSPLTANAVEDLVELVNPFVSKQHEAELTNGVQGAGRGKTSAIEDMHDSLLF